MLYNIHITSQILTTNSKYHRDISANVHRTDVLQREHQQLLMEIEKNV